MPFGRACSGAMAGAQAACGAQASAEHRTGDHPASAGYRLRRNGAHRWREMRTATQQLRSASWRFSDAPARGSEPWPRGGIWRPMALSLSPLSRHRQLFWHCGRPGVRTQRHETPSAGADRQAGLGDRTQDEQMREAAVTIRFAALHVRVSRCWCWLRCAPSTHTLERSCETGPARLPA